MLKQKQEAAAKALKAAEKALQKASKDVKGGSSHTDYGEGEAREEEKAAKEQQKRLTRPLLMPWPRRLPSQMCQSQSYRSDCLSPAQRRKVLPTSTRNTEVASLHPGSHWRPWWGQYAQRPALLAGARHQLHRHRRPPRPPIQTTTASIM